MPSDERTVAAVIPVLNCVRTVSRVVRQVRALGLMTAVVDDGSSDGSAAEAREAGATVLRHARNRGKGHSLVTGFRWALERGADAVVTLDADGQHDPGDLPRLLALAGEADLVVGQRRLERAWMPRASFVGNCVSSFFISLFCGRTLPDTQCGYRLYSRRLLSLVTVEGGRFETETELLMRASLLGLRVEWIPVDTIYDNGVSPRVSNFRTLPDTLRVIRVVLRSPWFPRGMP